jgi:hypothetical protein
VKEIRVSFSVCRNILLLPFSCQENWEKKLEIWFFFLNFKVFAENFHEGRMSQRVFSNI